jgi:hypothetical protein
MNLRNRIWIAIPKLLGLIMLASGISGLLMGNSTQAIPPKMVAFTQVFWASGIFQMGKVTEILAGVMLLVGSFPALATLAPCARCNRNCYRQHPVDALNFVAWRSCLCADRVFGVPYWGKYKSIFSRN